MRSDEDKDGVMGLLKGGISNTVYFGGASGSRDSARGVCDEDKKGAWGFLKDGSPDAVGSRAASGLRNGVFGLPASTEERCFRLRNRKITLRFPLDKTLRILLKKTLGFPEFDFGFKPEGLDPSLVSFDILEMLTERS